MTSHLRLDRVSDDRVAQLSKRGINVERIRPHRGPTLAEEATQVNIGVQRELASSVTTFRNLLMTVFGLVGGYGLVVAVFTGLLIVSPLQTAQWLGITKTSVNKDAQVLGVQTPSIPVRAVFQPVGRVALGIVRIVKPDSYAQVAKVAILDPNDVLTVDSSGVILPELPIKIPRSSLLQIGSSELIANLNAQLLQGLQPGSNPGDIAIVGETTVPTLPELGRQPVTLDQTTLNIDTASPLTGGGAVELGGTLTLTCPGCITSIDGLTAGNLASGDFSSKITSGTYSINVLGNAATATTATSFSGPLAGDVTGTQGATVISALTTANFGSPNISQWTNNSGYITESTTDILTNKSISGLTNTFSNVGNSALTNSSLTVDTTGPLSGGGAVSLGSLITLSCPTCLVSGGSLFTAIATSGSNSSILQSGTLTLAAGSNVTTTNNGTGTITLATVANPIFSGLSTDGTGVVTLDSSGALNLTSDSASTWTLPSVANALNFDSNTLSIDALNNRIGIGIAAPSTGLSVLGNSSTGNIASFTNLNTTVNATASVLRLGIGVTTTENIPRFVQFYQASTTDSDGTGVGYIRLNNNGVSFVSGTADFAEWTEVIDSPDAGDIVQSVAAGNQKALPGNLLLGVVTDSAIIVGNESADNTGKAIIGFLGRVNTKVSNENGNIAIGDPIAASSVAGVGMKQTKAGPTIGKALASKTGATVERIAIQVVPGWYDPDPLLTPSSFSISGSDVLDLNLDVVTRVGGFQDIFAGDISIADELILGTGVLNLTSTSGALTLSGLSASSISSGANGFDFTSANFNTTATGINSTAIGATTVSTGAFSSISSTGLTSLGNNSSTIAIDSTNFDLTTAGLMTLIGGLSTDLTTPTATALTIDSGTTGGLNFGTGANAKILTIGNTFGATALNINSGTGNINLTVGSTAASEKVQIGNSGTATPDLLVLDNGTADPTGVVGGMYYNTITNKFRCFENGAWANCISSTGTDLQHAASYDADEALTNIPGVTQVVLGTVSVTPSSATGDVYVTGFAEVRSSNGTDQPFSLIIETTSNCTGSTVGNASVTYTITSGASTTNHYGNIRVSGIAVDAGALANPYSLCASVSAGDTDVLNWGIEAIVVDTGADLAEIYTTHDATLGPADVVSYDSTLKTGMRKSQLAYDPGLLGVITTSPGFVIGGVDKEGVAALPVALSGRVPVKVNLENGPISGGDYLTSSSIPGVAMKAVKSGPSIGMALADYDGHGDTVLAFIKGGSYTPVQVQEESSFLKSIADTITNAFRNVVEFFGNVIFHTNVTFLGRPTFNKDTAGHAYIKAGDNETRVTFEKEYPNNPVVTANVNIVGGVRIEEIPNYAIYDLSATGFMIKLARVAPFDLEFSWVALFASETGDLGRSGLNIETLPTTTPVESSPSPSSSPSPTETPKIDLEPLESDETASISGNVSEESE